MNFRRSIAVVVCFWSAAACGDRPFVRDESGVTTLPNWMRDALTAHRCDADSGSNCADEAATLACAEPVARCAGGFCSFKRAPGCACYQDEIEYCRVGGYVTGNTCDYGVRRCMFLDGHPQWSQCNRQAICEARACMTGSAKCPTGTQSWGNGGWNPCLPTRACLDAPLGRPDTSRVWSSKAARSTTARDEVHGFEVRFTPCTSSNPPAGARCWQERLGGYALCSPMPSEGRPVERPYMLLPEACVPPFPCGRGDFAWSEGRAAFGVQGGLERKKGIDGIVRPGFEPASECRLAPGSNTELEGQILLVAGPGKPLVHIEAYYEDVQPGVVHGAVLFQYAAPEFLERTFDRPAPGADRTTLLDLAIQMMDDQDHWVDVMARPVPRTTSGWAEISATVDPNRPIRLQLRVPADGNGLGITFIDARLFVPECVPDAANPGHCL